MLPIAGFQFDYVFDWTILKYQQSQIAAPPSRPLVSRTTLFSSYMVHLCLTMVAFSRALVLELAQACLQLFPRQKDRQVSFWHTTLCLLCALFSRLEHVGAISAVLTFANLPITSPCLSL